MPKILVATPVRQDPKILAAYLFSLTQLEQDGLEIEYCFVDDNESPLSSAILQGFSKQYPTIILPKMDSDVSYQKTTDNQLV